MTHLASSLFEPTIQKTCIWLNEISEKMHFEDKQEAYHALRAVLHALRDRLTVELAAHLSSQLPLLLRGVFFEGWKPSKVPIKVSNKQDFINLVREHSQNRIVDNQAEKVITCVMEVLSDHIDVGELSDIYSDLPHELKDFLFAKQKVF
ncbi:MAG: DUF2267 domain-containing protein [Chlamydiales bacterium]